MLLPFELFSNGQDIQVLPNGQRDVEAQGRGVLEWVRSSLFS